MQYHSIIYFMFFTLLMSIPFLLHSNSISDEELVWDKKIDSLISSHPEVLSWKESIRSIYHAKESVGVLPDTKIGFAYRSYPVRGRNPLSPDLRDRDDTPGMTGREISIIQGIPYLEKLRSDKKLLYWDYQSEIEKYQLLRNELLGNLYFLINEKRQLQDELISWKNIQNIQIAVSRISQAKFSSGEENSSSSLRNKNENLKVKEKLIEMDTKIKEVEESLNYYLVSLSKKEQEDLESNIGLILESKWTNLLERLNSSAIHLTQQNPNTKLLNYNFHKAKEKERRDNLEFYPDAEVFLAYMNRNSRLFRVSENPLNYGNIMATDEFSGDLLSFGVTFNIPTWSLATKNDLNQKNRSLKSKEIQARVALERKLESDYRRLTKSIVGTNERIVYYKESLLPSLQRSSRISSGNIDKDGDSTSILKFRLEYLNAQIEFSNLIRQKHQSIIQILELTNSLLSIDSSNSIPNPSKDEKDEN